MHEKLSRSKLEREKYKNLVKAILDGDPDELKAQLEEIIRDVIENVSEEASNY